MIGHALLGPTGGLTPSEQKQRRSEQKQRRGVSEGRWEQRIEVKLQLGCKIN